MASSTNEAVQPATTYAEATEAEKHAVLRKVTGSSFLGNFIEWFDYASYSYLATVIAMVFFPAEEVNQCADQIRQAAGRGHKVGLIPTGNTPAQRLESVEAGSRQLAGILRQETWFVLSKESTLAEAGYLCWTPSLTFSSVTDPTRTYETLVRAGEQQGSALRVLVHSQSAGGALAGVLGQLAQDGDTFLPARETSY